jgi:hypothetical protein
MTSSADISTERDDLTTADGVVVCQSGEGDDASTSTSMPNGSSPAPIAERA